MNKGCGTIFLGAYREFYGNRFGKNPNCMSQRKRTRSLGCSCNGSPSIRSWTDSFGATENNVTEEVEPGLFLSTTSLDTEPIVYAGGTPNFDETTGTYLSDTGGNDLLDSVENPVAYNTAPKCTQIVGKLYNEAGTGMNYTNGCQRQDLVAQGFVYLDAPNLRTGSDLQVDQTRTATDTPAITARAIPSKLAFYSPWNKTGTIRTANTSKATNNPCGNANYAYRQDNVSPYDNSAIGDPYCWCDKSQSACDLNPKINTTDAFLCPAPPSVTSCIKNPNYVPPSSNAAPLIALAALAFLATS